jgi:hypothetical protein
MRRAAHTPENVLLAAQANCAPIWNPLIINANSTKIYTENHNNLHKG